jgi:hypothetical protein
MSSSSSSKHKQDDQVADEGGPSSNKRRRFTRIDEGIYMERSDDKSESEDPDKIGLEEIIEEIIDIKRKARSLEINARSTKFALATLLKKVREASL